MSKRPKIFIPFMSYGGMVHTEYMTSMLELSLCLRAADVGVCFTTIKCESLVSRGRNGAIALFLKTDADYILFIDTDLRFDPSAVLKMLKLGVGVVGGAYPKKAKDDSPYGLSFANSGRVVSTKVDDVYLVDYLPGGFMLIQRSAIEKIQDSGCALKYRNNLKMYETSTEFTDHYDMFPCPIVNGTYLSEDYGFCNLCKQAEVTVFLYSNITFTHYANNYPFTGNLEDKLRLENIPPTS